MRKEAVSIRVSSEILHHLDQLADLNRTTRSKVMERVLRNFLQQRAAAQHDLIRNRGEPA
jgi:predicted transcriptional regulator